MPRQRTRGPQERELLQWAEREGWQPQARGATGHLCLLHRTTGVTCTIPGKLAGYLFRATQNRLRRLVTEAAQSPAAAACAGR